MGGSEYIVQRTDDGGSDWDDWLKGFRRLKDAQAAIDTLKPIAREESRRKVVG